MCKHPVFATGKVYGYDEDSKIKCSGQKDSHVYLLNILVVGTKIPETLPGQFFMLRSEKSKALLGRPISVFSCKDKSIALSLKYDGGPITEISFLIMEKGEGTRALCGLKNGDVVEMLGPIGNSFPKPAKGEKACLVSGGIGIAPIAGFAYVLPRRSFDYYACFKYGSYDEIVDGINANNIYIADETGKDGTKGMLDAILTADIIRKKKYTVVYGCGPTPMLRYLQRICEEAGVKCWLSLESRMACGVGACLGCTVLTKSGYKRCCKDGPVFDASEVVLYSGKPEVFTGSNTDDEMPDLSVEIAGVKFDNPVIAASGTFGFGTEYDGVIDVKEIGGICSKGLTITPRTGNSGIRIFETPSGMMNSIGLQNPGIKHFIEHELPEMQDLGPVIIANLSGSSIRDYVEGAELLANTDIAMIELNISCPNVREGGMAFGMNPDSAREVVSEVRRTTNKPLIVKLTPNAPDLTAVTYAVADAGADAISLINTFQALAIDIHTGATVFDNTCAGLSGPGIKPIALRMVYDVACALKRRREWYDREIPIIGLGGISTWQDAIEFIMAGATAIQVGTATFSNPRAMLDIIDGINFYMELHQIKTLDEIRGMALPK